MTLKTTVSVLLGDGVSDSTADKEEEAKAFGVMEGVTPSVKTDTALDEGSKLPARVVIPPMVELLDRGIPEIGRVVDMPLTTDIVDCVAAEDGTGVVESSEAVTVDKAPSTLDIGISNSELVSIAIEEVDASGNAVLTNIGVAVDEASMPVSDGIGVGTMKPELRIADTALVDGSKLLT